MLAGFLAEDVNVQLGLEITSRGYSATQGSESDQLQFGCHTFVKSDEGEIYSVVDLAIADAPASRRLKAVAATHVPICDVGDPSLTAGCLTATPWSTMCAQVSP
jgi:hypothetical protein